MLPHKGSEKYKTHAHPRLDSNNLYIPETLINRFTRPPPKNMHINMILAHKQDIYIIHKNISNIQN